ncbi:MAG: hypothetical protein H0U74_22955 [Bradymonadaceae bacterium]|nr:hypothetical protein [Lujinxingiaceae bacterium]
MKKFVFSQPGAVLASVYNLELSEQEWITQLTRAISPFIDGGNGTLGCIFRMGRQIEMPVLKAIRGDDEVPAFIQYLRATEQASGGKSPDGARFGKLFAASGMGTLSVNRASAQAYQVFRQEFQADGMLDAAGLIVPHPASRSFIFITSRQRELSAVPERARSRWVELQNHIAAVYDLRYRLRGNSFEETDAVWFNTGGDCVESGPSGSDTLRAQLRDAVQMREKVRSGNTGAKRIDLETYWANVLSGHWAILDRFDTDGRRYVIALPIAQYGTTLRGLSEREREVLDQLGDGLANKVIAAELGISTPAVASHLNNIYTKLSIHDRGAVVQLVQQVRKKGERLS